MHHRIRQLDAVRGVAIVLVILHNTTAEYPSLHLQHLFANGWMGVDLFFVLSGFLITGILVDTRHAEGYLTNFYARRCLRIWPLYYSLIVFMFVVVPVLRPSDTQAILERSSPWWAWRSIRPTSAVTGAAGRARWARCLARLGPSCCHRGRATSVRCPSISTTPTSSRRAHTV